MACDLLLLGNQVSNRPGWIICTRLHGIQTAYSVQVLDVVVTRSALCKIVGLALTKWVPAKLLFEIKVKPPGMPGRRLPSCFSNNEVCDRRNKAREVD